MIGSSPLARGTVRRLPHTSRLCSVHPRWRGEQKETLSVDRPAGGSSPLARGTADRVASAPQCPRFIPAGAGNRVSPMRTGLPSAVHPRWRGEQGSWIQIQLSASGSSPLARGTVAHGGLFFRVRRFIPAGAGNSDPRYQNTTLRTVHPRWRGEQFVFNWYVDRNNGSSPLARGTG